MFCLLRANHASTNLQKFLSWKLDKSSLLGSLSNYDDDHNDDFKKTNMFNDQDNSSARASRFLVHFFDVHSTTTTWNLLIWRFMDVDARRRIFLPLFEPA